MYLIDNVIRSSRAEHPSKWAFWQNWDSICFIKIKIPIRITIILKLHFFLMNLSSVEIFDKAESFCNAIFFIVL